MGQHAPRARKIELDEAEASSYNQAIALKPDYVEAHNNLGVTLQELGRLDEAQTSYTKAIALKPDYVQTQSNLGNTLKELGRLDEVEASYTQAIALKPCCQSPLQLGCPAARTGENETGRSKLQTNTALKSDYVDAHNNLGYLLQELDRSEEAEISLRQALALKSDYADIHNNLGRTLKN